MNTNEAVPGELFTLTDEQILEIDPEPSGSDAVGQPLLPALSRERTVRDVDFAETKTAQAGLPAPLEPPAWLARQMNDPWSGEEARELWAGVQQARTEAAAYRAAIASPEEARTLKELYPGGVEQARATAERARALEEIDAAFFGGAGKSAQEISAGRTALADRMLREDPSAFREMVFAGLRALEAFEHFPQTPFSPAPAPPSPPNVVPGFSPASSQPNATQSHPQAQNENPVPEGARRAVPVEPATQNAHVAEYRAFEKSANDELERSVGGAINRALAQALPEVRPTDGGSSVGARYIAPLQQRLGGAIRADVEAALKGDTQLGEQIAQVLSARRFDDTTRAQVVRLINDRARQLVPSAAKRVIQEWSQTAFATHRARTHSIDRSDESPSVAPNPIASSGSSARNSSAIRTELSRNVSARAAAADRAEKSVDIAPRAAARAQGRAVDYRKLSDEQILDL